MIEYNGQVYRNLQEQVKKNKDDIELLNGNGTITKGDVSFEFTATDTTVVIDGITSESMVVIETEGTSIGAAVVYDLVVYPVNGGLQATVNSIPDSPITCQYTILNGRCTDKNNECLVIDKTTPAVVRGITYSPSMLNMNQVLKPNNYYVGTGAMLNLNLTFPAPNAAYVGKDIYVRWYSGQVATTLTVEQLYTTPLDVTPSSMSICEIYAEYDNVIQKWVLSYKEVPV